MQLSISSPGDTTGRLLLEQGGLAGRCYRVETGICQNPVCECEHVTLRCFPETTEPPSQASIFVCLEMDLDQQDIANLEKLKADPKAITLAKAVAEEISEADWNNLRYSYFQAKQYWTEHTDLEQIDAHFPPEVMAGNESMVGYYEILPYAKPVEFTVGAEPWLADDQYCVKPRCTCQEALLSFFRLRVSAESRRSPTGPSLSIRYAYKTERIEPLPGAEDGRLSGQVFVEELRKVLPDLNSLLAKRHALLQRLYRRASRGKTIRLQAPKLGRNDPCPCGSGKKYKKCCGA
jgi:hypothetical protein